MSDTLGTQLRTSHISHRIAVAFIAMVLMLSACRSGRTEPPAGVPDRLPIEAARFSIIATTDSTVHFRAGDVRWLRTGMSGYAVDPTARDAFVARLELVGELQGEFTALVTGQIRPVDSSHVVIVERPATPAWRKRDFWWGAAWGAVAGALIAVAAKFGG